MFKPLATYRIQFHQNFTFQDLKAQLPYLKQLGIDTIYAAPIFEAIPGSTHGYDVVNPLRINPEIGTELELRELSQSLRDHGMYWIQDIVPNHMAFHRANAWLMDVLANGSKSTFYPFFDFLFDDPSEKIVLPFLGEPLADAIAQRNIKIGFDNSYQLEYGDHSWPVSATSLTSLTELDPSTDVAQLLDKVNGNPTILKQLIDAQYYLPMQFADAGTVLNYRRFFTVNELICLRMEDPAVFDHYHSYLLQLFHEGIFQGFRIDHIDGLAAPHTYLERLRQATGSEAYIVVEKILGATELLPQSWPIQGATGYEFLAQTNQLLTAKASQEQFDRLYLAFTDNQLDIEQQALLKKRFILENYLQSELAHLAQLLETLLSTQAPSGADVKTYLKEFLVNIPVYRYYFDEPDWIAMAYKPLQSIAKNLKAEIPFAKEITHLLFVEEMPNPNVIQFLNRCMQFAGPLTAKGIEDTLFYTFNRAIGLNEVGDHPDTFGSDLDTFHQQMQQRLELTPYALNTTATHDTKRGEDARTRLHAWSACPEIWESLLQKLQEAQVLFADESPIHPNDAYLLLQSLLATIPVDRDIDQDYRDRIAAYIEKALRESKKRTLWESPNADYEQNLQRWLQQHLQENSLLVESLKVAAQQLQDLGRLNSFALLTLKVTCPGIPDFYQGSESWNFSLVDPDNRRPVAYNVLQQELHVAEGEQIIPLPTTLKLEKSVWAAKLLGIRKAYRETFEEGEYIHVAVQGSLGAHIVAYMRKSVTDTLLIVAAIRLSNAQLSAIQEQTFDWKDTVLLLPETVAHCGVNLLNQEEVFRNQQSRHLRISELFDDTPIAIVVLTRPKTRSSGILAHLSSLPSTYGIGDMGNGARSFVDFLARHAQRYWQLLPLNPTTSGAAHSPYSSYSAFAGNPLFIDLEQLVSLGWLTKLQVKEAQIDGHATVAYGQVSQHKNDLLQLAFQQFIQKATITEQAIFLEFCEQNHEWLHDFALFSIIDQTFGTNWDQWPTDLKFRDVNALQVFAEKQETSIKACKWIQYVFFTQWDALKSYASDKQVQFIGDLPFYVACHSADVWANPKLFELDLKECPSGFAGAPPDAHSSEGQHWGMPLYRWKDAPKDLFEWWTKRISQNLRLYDLLRLDHFRAFHSYWAIPAGSPAIAGHWIAGPGQALFDHLRSQLGKLPFIAEDLGTAMDLPIRFREAMGFPGMKVIQFGFGTNYAYAKHLPHQYENSNAVVYLGTHDNNTIKGWYEDETDDLAKLNVNLMIGHSINAEKIHEELIRYAHASVADLSIIQLQDVLGLGSANRMNIPGTTEHNWLWRCDSAAIEKEYAWFKHYTQSFGRA